MSYVFFDIDGTLYDPFIGIPDSCKEAIRLLKERGHHPFISSGRTKCMIFQEVNDLGFDGYVMGAGLQAEYQGKLLFREDLPYDEVKRVVDILRSFNLMPFAEGYEHFYYDQTVKCDNLDYVMKIFRFDDLSILRSIDDPDIKTAKISGMVIDERSDLEGARRALKDDYFTVVHKSDYLETIKHGASKGGAIKRLSEIIGFDMEDTYAFGDSFNDYDMLTTVEHGYVMENGDPKLLSLITNHCPPLGEDGIYRCLRGLGLI